MGIKVVSLALNVKNIIVATIVLIVSTCANTLPIATQLEVRDNVVKPSTKIQ
jgi:hypothetical protein